MSPTVVALIILVIVFGGAMVGLWLQQVLPDQHLSADTKDVVRLATALVATISALVLSLLVSSANSSFARFDDELTQNAARVIMLDRTLDEYGPSTRAIRDSLKARFERRMELVYATEAEQAETTDRFGAVTQEENIDSRLFALDPQGPAQQGLQARALELNDEINTTNALIHVQREDSLPWPLLMVLGTWLTLIFSTFGLFAPRNPVVTGALLVCSMSAAGAVFLILELNSPFTGVIRVSIAPMREALLLLGR
ncbi:MAG: hypothetical protein KA135_01775 [Halioglobus sp.]|nr:hypothetical protein [Halioglobus sp.]